MWAAGAVIALTAAVATVILVVHTARFRGFIVEQIEEKVDATLGARLTVRRMAIDWRLLEFDFYGVTLRGREISPQPPLFAAENVRVRLKIVSIVRGEVAVSEIVLDQPVAHIYVDASGNSNLPRPPGPPRSGSSSVASGFASIIHMAIQHVQVNSGRFFYNNEEVPLSAELRDFQSQIYFNRLVPEYRGTLSYDDGRIVVANFRPVAHRLQLAFTASQSGIVLNPITVSMRESTLTAQAKLANYDDLHFSGTYDGAISTGEVLRIADRAPVATGMVSVSGKFAFHREANKSWAENTDLDGALTSRQLRLAAGRKIVTADSVRAHYRLQNGDLSVNQIGAAALGGRLTANYELLHVAGKSASRLEGSVENASLERMNDAAAAPDLKSVQLMGRVNGTIRAAWTSRIHDGVVRLRLLISNPSQPVTQSAAIPLSGLIDVVYDGARNYASFGKSYVTARNTTATVTGILSSESRLNTEVATSDLHELGALESVFESGSSNAGTLRWLSDLHGAARFDGQVLGSLSDPRVQGRLSANNLEIQKTRWRALRVNLDAGSAGISLQNGLLNDTQNGQITFNLHADLRGWSFGPSNPVSLQLTARDISIAAIQKFTQSSYPVTGTLAANVSLQGSEQNPVGQGSLQVSRASAWNEPLNNLAVDFKGDGNSIRASLELAVPAGNLSGELTYEPGMKSYDAVLKSAGIRLEKLQAPQIRSLDVSGTAAFSAAGHGTLSNPQVLANLQIPQLRIRDWVVSDIQAELNSANRHANFVLSSKAEQASIQAKGNVQLTGEYPATASVDVRAIPVAVVLAKFLRNDQKIQGEADLQANLKGPLKDPSAIVAQVDIPKLTLAYQSENLALVRPLQMQYAKGSATIREAQFKGTGTALTLAGTIPVKSAAPLNVSANGTVDLSLLQTFAPDFHSSGRIDLNLSVRGELAHPAMQGQIHIVDARLSAENIPVGLDGINAVLQVSGNRMEVTEFSGSAGGGTVSAHGFMTYGEPSNFNLGLDLKSVRLRYPEGLRSILSGNLALNGTQANSHLTGRILVDRLSLTQQFDLANFLGQFATETPSTPSTPLERNMKLNVVVATAEEVSLANSKVSVEGTANLTLIGTIADPVIQGRTTLTGGDMFFMGKRYQIQSGTIEFANPVRTTPVLNLYVTTTVQQYNITLNFIGPANRLRTNYTSDPPLASADIINMLAFGQTAEQAASSPSTPAALGAESVLAQGVAGQVSNKIEQLTGISQLTIDPLAGSTQANPGSQVAIQERVSGNILLTFSTDVTTTQNQAIQVQYQLKKNLSISVLRDQYGGYAADVRFHKSF